MTVNQQSAVRLAEALRAGTVQPIDIADIEWGLLLLAAGLTSPSSLPLIVANRVLRNHQDRKGFFAPRASRLQAAVNETLS